MEGVLRLTASYTVARMLERDDFAKRYARGPADLDDGVPLPAHAGRTTRSRSRRTSSSGARISCSTCWSAATSSATYGQDAAGRAHDAAAGRDRRRPEDEPVARQLRGDHRSAGRDVRQARPGARRADRRRTGGSRSTSSATRPSRTASPRASPTAPWIPWAEKKPHGRRGRRPVPRPRRRGGAPRPRSTASTERVSSPDEVPDVEIPGRDLVGKAGSVVPTALAVLGLAASSTRGSDACSSRAACRLDGELRPSPALELDAVDRRCGAACVQVGCGRSRSSRLG